MRKLLVALIILPLLACAGDQFGGGINIGGLTPPEQSVCAQEGYENSWICKACAQANLTPEDLNGLILDAVALTVIVGDMTSEDTAGIVQFLNQVESYTSIEGLTWTVLIGLVEDDSTKAAAIAGILNRRIQIFQSDDMISSVDMEMIRYHIGEMKKILGY